MAGNKYVAVNNAAAVQFYTFYNFVCRNKNVFNDAVNCRDRYRKHKA